MANPGAREGATSGLEYTKHDNISHVTVSLMIYIGLARLQNFILFCVWAVQIVAEEAWTKHHPPWHRPIYTGGAGMKSFLPWLFLDYQRCKSPFWDNVTWAWVRMPPECGRAMRMRSLVSQIRQDCSVDAAENGQGVTERGVRERLT